jgi:chemotaxis protein MotB
VPYQHTRQLMEAITKVIATMPNRVSISGHTDATPYARGASYTNWELSTDRAHASRRELIHFGLPAGRITRVVGRADTEHLIKSDPTSSRNRRISITLLHQALPPPKVSNVSRPAAAPAPSRQAPPPGVVNTPGNLKLAPPAPGASP